jgi:hypothetical protein
MPGFTRSSSLFHRPLRVWIWLAALTVILLGSASTTRAHPRRAAEQGPTLSAQETIAGYTVWIYADPGCGGSYFNLTHAGRMLFTSRPLCDAALRVGALYPDDPDERILQPGADLTGNGRPDLVVTGFSGGSNCCLSFYIFQIGSDFRPLGVIRELDADHATPHFVRLEPGKGVQIVLHDWTFAGWHANWGDSPAPLVILEYRDGRFRPARSLMNQPAPPRRQLDAKANRIRVDAMTENFGDPVPRWPGAKIPPAMWATMLTLIYTGHAELAWKFADVAWPPRVRGKALFLDQFRERLHQSPYYRELMAMQVPEPTPKPTPTVTPSPGYAPIPTPPPTPSPTPYPSATSTPSAAVTPSPGATSSATPAPTPYPTASMTASPSPTQHPSASATASPSASH